MTRRLRHPLGGIALAALVAFTVTGCSKAETTAEPTPTTTASTPKGGAALNGIVFDVHRDPG